jgi:small-conductance mechanosensitive channel
MDALIDSIRPDLQPVIASRPGRIALILVGTVLASLLVQWIYRVFFRRIASRTSSTYDDTVFPLLHRPVRNTILLIGVTMILPVLGWGPETTSVLRKIVHSVLIILWTSALIRVLSTTLRHLGPSGRIAAVQPRTVPLFDTVQKVVLAGGAIYVFFLVWNINVTAWIASAGIAGIAVGFAAKDTLANLFSGVFILVDSPYRIGDMIMFDTGERGRVTDVGIRSTRILTRDDVEITIPNAAIGAAKITNESGGPHRKRRVDIRVGVSYASDVTRVRRVLLEVAEELDMVCSSPEPRIRFREMGDSALIFSLLFWIRDPEDRGRAVDSVNTRIFERFREEEIEIPFPQRVVHLPSPPAPPRGD